MTPNTFKLTAILAGINGIVWLFIGRPWGAVLWGVATVFALIGWKRAGGSTKPNASESKQEETE